MTNPSETLPPLFSRRTPKGPLGQEIQPFGGAPSTVSPGVQQDVFKELINKLAWSIGSTYAVNYSARNATVVEYAKMCAHAIIRDHGYPPRDK